MKILQVKYCYSEYETNQFLRDLSIKNIHSIQYCAKMYGDGGETYNNSGDKVEKMTVGSDVVAIIQYFEEVLEEI